MVDSTSTYIAVRANAAGADTGINAAIVLALQVAATVDIVQALAAVAVRQRIAAEAGRAGADRPAAGGLLADGVHAARTAAAAVGLGCGQR